jgi:ankyrin repeat protein
LTKVRYSAGANSRVVTLAFPVTQLLIDSGADINARNDLGCSILQVAILTEQKDILITLLGSAHLNVQQRVCHPDVWVAVFSSWCRRMPTVKLRFTSLSTKVSR